MRIVAAKLVAPETTSSPRGPTFLPGEQLEVLLVKPGEEAGQGVGYLDDGTMIVVESARERIHQTVKVTVTSVLQTSAGRMIFGR